VRAPLAGFEGHNGKGTEPASLKEGRRSGHYGLPGMRERAEPIGQRASPERSARRSEAPAVSRRFTRMRCAGGWPHNACRAAVLPRAGRRDRPQLRSAHFRVPFFSPHGIQVRRCRRIDRRMGVPALATQPGLDVEQYTRVFRKELRLRDVVLAQILVILGLSGPGMAARAGNASLVFWALAFVLFYVPLALMVVKLSRLMPLEGGIYQWVKLGFNDLTGFLVGWNNWLFGVFNMSAIGLLAATALSYAAGPRGAWIAGSKAVIATAACVLICGMTLVAALGLRIGKWVHNAGSVVVLTVFGVLVLLPLLRLGPATAASAHALDLEIPRVMIVNLAILVRIAAYALGGLEYLAIFAGECRNPARTIGRSVTIAAPVVAALNVLATYSILNFVEPSRVNLINPAAQVLSLAFDGAGPLATVVSVSILLFLLRDISQTTCIFTGSTRLPVVAGWDHLLPEWFTRLHPRLGTPANSIVFVGAVSLAAALLSVVGAAEQEAYQLLLNASGVFVVFGYVPLFLLPLFGFKEQPIRFPFWLKIGSLSGLTVTALFIILSVVPIVDVGSTISYSLKIGGVIIGANVLGAALYATRGGATRR
jgi:glutamate:GABA antiporter